MRKHYDVLVIGTGAANIVLDAALEQGLNCAVIERGRFGGTCLNRGCIPTKVLVTAADYVEEIKELPAIGIEVNVAKMNWPMISKRVWEKIDESYEVEKYYRSFENCTIYNGEGFFVAEKILQVRLKDDTLSEEITAEKIFIDIGAKTKLPELENREEVGYLSSESLFGDKYPKKPFAELIIVGGGPIGCEFAHIFAAAGTKVTLVQHNTRLLPKAEEEISEQILENMLSRGISVYLNSDLREMHKVQEGKKLLFANRTSGEITEVQAEEIMFASGIEPVSGDLKIEKSGITTLKGGWIATNEFMETNIEGVYALGDVNGQAAFRHKANYEAEILAHNLFSNKVPQQWRWARYDLVPAITFTFPQVAQVGMTERDALLKGYEVKIGKQFYRNTAKGFAMGLEKDSDGFVKLIIDKVTDDILGVHIIGPQASLLLQPFINLMNAGLAVIKPINEHIGSSLVCKLREEKLERYLDPHKIQSVGETMTPHPSLAETIMWVQYYLK